VTSLFKTSRDLAATQTFLGQVAGKGNDLLLSLMGHQLLTLGAPPERRVASRVATHRELCRLPRTHPRTDQGALVLGDGLRHLSHEWSGQ
jgi:hypothetical protein